MIRTQVYLEETQGKEIKLLSQLLGKTQSVFIRDAIYEYITKHTAKKSWKTHLLALQGTWKDKNLSEEECIRREFDRSL